MTTTDTDACSILVNIALPLLTPLDQTEDELKSIIERIDADRRITSTRDSNLLLFYLLSCDDPAYESTFLIDHPQTDVEKRQNYCVMIVKLCRIISRVDLETGRTLFTYAYAVADTARDNPILLMIVSHLSAVVEQGPEYVIDEMFRYAARPNSSHCTIL